MSDSMAHCARRTHVLQAELLQVALDVLDSHSTDAHEGHDALRSGLVQTAESVDSGYKRVVELGRPPQPRLALVCGDGSARKRGERGSR